MVDIIPLKFGSMCGLNEKKTSVLFSFFSFMVFKKGQITNNNLYYVLSFLGFFNVLFMNNSRDKWFRYLKENVR